MLILYADILFIINFSMDFLGLFICSKVMQYKATRGRILLASLIGGLYGVASMVVKLEFVWNCILCVMFAAIMSVVCFKEKNFSRWIALILMYIFISATLGGLMSIVYTFLNNVISLITVENTYVTYGGARLFIIIGLTSTISLIFSRILLKRKNIEFVELSIKMKSSSYTLKGLCDSGNLLVEPFSGKGVILVSEDSLLGKEISSINDYKVKYIPFRDVSGEGILKGVLPKEIKINGKTTDAIVATTKKNNFNGYDALVPKTVL